MFLHNFRVYRSYKAVPQWKKNNFYCWHRQNSQWISNAIIKFLSSSKTTWRHKNHKSCWWFSSHRMVNEWTEIIAWLLFSPVTILYIQYKTYMRRWEEVLLNIVHLYSLAIGTQLKIILYFSTSFFLAVLFFPCFSMQF